MSATANCRANSPDPVHLTFLYTKNEDGWVTAQIAEFPEAISQGPTEHEAWVNVLDALHDLTHEPTLTERLAFTAQGRIVDPLEGLFERFNEVLRHFVDAGRDRQRDRVL